MIKIVHAPLNFGIIVSSVAFTGLPMSTIDEYLRANAGRFENELFELLRIPSVSADVGSREGVARAAAWLAVVASATSGWNRAKKSFRHRSLRSSMLQYGNTLFRNISLGTASCQAASRHARYAY